MNLGCARRPDLAGQQIHGAEYRGAEWAGIDSHGPIEPILQRVTGHRAANRARQTGDVRKADAQVEWDHRATAGGQRQPERKICFGRAAALKEQRPTQRGQGQAKGVWVPHTSPQPNRCATKRSIEARPHQLNFRATVINFRELRGLHERPKAPKRGARNRPRKHDRDAERNRVTGH
jgi:hypothetical protein